MRILCFGDSNTYGYDPRDFFGGRYSPEDRWVNLLAAITGHETIQAGANGREIPRSLQNFPEHTYEDLLLVMLGTNDLLQGASGEKTAARMETFLTLLMPHFHKILLVSPPPMKRGAWVPSDTLVSESISLTEEYHLVANRLHIPFVDTRSWNVELTFDGVHFTEAGHHTFANRIMDFL